MVLPQALYNGFIGARASWPSRLRADAEAHDVQRARRLDIVARRMPGRRVLALGGGHAHGGFLALRARQLWYLQVLEGGRLQELSDKNRIRIRPVAAPRGILFDRNGLPLVDNRPGLHALPDPARDRAATRLVARAGRRCCCRFPWAS